MACQLGPLLPQHVGGCVALYCCPAPPGRGSAWEQQIEGMPTNPEPGVRACVFLAGLQPSCLWERITTPPSPAL